MPASTVGPASMRNVAERPRTRYELWRRPPLPNASPAPRTVTCTPFFSVAPSRAGMKRSLESCPEKLRLYRVIFAAGPEAWRLLIMVFRVLHANREHRHVLQHVPRAVCRRQPVRLVGLPGDRHVVLLAG